MSKITLNPESLQAWVADNAEAKRYNYHIPAGGVVLDLGGCIGDFYRPAIAKWPFARFVVFEPTEYAGTIPIRAQDLLVNAAAWIYNGKLKLGGSFFATGMFEDGKNEFDCVDIDKYITGPVDLMKINI